MPTMPNVLGLNYESALQAMVVAGVRVLPLGYFQADPVTINWIAGAGVPPAFVSAQSPASGAIVAANSAVTLTCEDFPVSVAYGGGTQV